jgi:hypothetical protein
MKIIYSFSFFLFILLIGCKKKEEPKKVYHLTPEDMTWNIYHVGDTIKLKSNYNNNREYCITSISQLMHNPGYYDDWNSYESLGIRFSRLDTVLYDNYISIILDRGYPGEPNNLVIFIGENDGLGLPDFFSLPNNPNLDSLTVNNNKYYNVYKVANFINNDVDSAANSLYYEKQKGWLRIKLNSGETFDRIN